MNAAPNSIIYLAFLDVDGAVELNAEVSLDVFRTNSLVTPVFVTTATESLDVVELFIGSLDPLLPGEYIVKWYVEDVVFKTETVTITRTKNPEILPGNNLQLFLPKTTTFAKFSVFDKYGETVEELAAATEVADLDTWKATVNVDTQGTYFVIWYTSADNITYSLHSVERFVAGANLGLLPITFVVGSAPNVAITDATLFIRNIDDDNLLVLSPDTNGSVKTQLEEGSYRATLVKNGFVFSTNNWLITITEDSTTFQLITTFVSVPESDPLPALNVTTLFIKLMTADGKAVRNAPVSVRLVEPPTNVLESGYAVHSFQSHYITDAYGYVEFALLAGSKIEVAITPLSLRRVVTVPDSADPINLFTLVQAAQDPFTIQNTNIPTLLARE